MDGQLGTENSGFFSMVVPDDAPLGDQSILTACTTALSNSIDLTVIVTPAPVVTSIQSPINLGGQVTIHGNNLSNVTTVSLVPVSGGNAVDCVVPVDGATLTSITCTPDQIGTGNFSVLVEQDDCGYAVDAPTLTIKTPST